MSRLKCIPILFLLCSCYIQLNAQQVGSEKVSPPTPGSEVLYPSIDFISLTWENEDVTLPSGNMPDEGEVIIIGRDHSHQLGIKKVDYASEFTYYFNLFPNENRRMHYWTIWFDWNENNKRDAGKEVIYMRNDVARSIELTRVGSTSRPITMEIDHSQIQFVRPNSSPKDAVKIVDEFYFMRNNGESNRLRGQEFNATNTIDLELFPNPTSDRVTINIQDDLAENAQLSLINSSGITVKEQSVKLHRGEAKITMELDHLTKGIYHVQIVTESQRKIKSIIIN